MYYRFSYLLFNNLVSKKMAGARWMIIGFVLTIGVDYTYCSTTTITTASSNELPETNDQNSPKFTSSPSQSTKRIESTGTGTHSPTTTTSETDSQPTAQPSQNSTESIHNDTGPHSTTDSHGDGTTQHKVIGGHEKDDHDTTHGIELFTFNFSNVKYPLVFSLVVILAGLSKIGFHYSHFLSSKVPESCSLIVIGVIFGVILHYTGVSENLTLFAPHEFFLFLLPPIILEAAFSLHDRTFAENIGGVLLFAVLGTVMNCFLIGLSMWGLYQAGAMEDVQCTLVQFLIFSALIVAVDPVAVLAVFQEIGVNNTLYFLVFGESLLNDGVTVVLYNVMHVFNKIDTISAGQVFLGVAKFLVVVGFGLLIGIFCGLVSSIITKYTNSVKVVEPLIVFGFAYLSYILSDLFEFSGIISIIACGIIQVHYAFQNITNKSRMGVKFFSKVMATASEIIIFLFLGNVTVKTSHAWMTGFSLWALLLCILYRFLTTYGISFFLNKYSTGRVRKIRLDEMFMISYGGLRGAVCFSLVALINEDEIPMKNMFVTTTLFIIFFTVFIQGGTIKWLVKKLRVKLADKDKDMSLNEEISNHVFDHIMAGVEEIIGYTMGDHQVKAKIDHIDDTYIRPVVLRNASRSTLGDISNYYEKLVMKEHYKNLQLSGAKLRRVKTDIRKLDSELALNTLVHDDDEKEAHDRLHDHVQKRDEEHLEENIKHGENHHKFLADTLHTVRSRLHLNVHDKNLTHDKQHHLISQLRKKYRQNMAIRERRERESLEQGQTLPSHSLSFNMDGSRAYEERKPSQVQFTLDDTEQEEAETEHTQGTDIEYDENGKATFMF
ncbi:Na(+)/H(+) exchanger protein 7-like isoform X2 [Mya arenaria]|uniref:Na(+)/H(+) exchanger protein 7-like isoform X2 n=1 Tax=Mya arenaria TaxID=6604 RepID=UPI0022E497C9|nr:Na(+)/H(+) exchanger protein 7-like isoform X2 [Mya arenaria]XP_052782540.1 Na(+)/H(+) exchanger protein 7-like isoform X2 [Mya arenaria]